MEYLSKVKKTDINEYCLKGRMISNIDVVWQEAVLHIEQKY
jgi:hypothetical protein